MKKNLKAKMPWFGQKSPQFELKTPQFRHSQWFHQKTPHFSTLAGSRHFKFFDATEGSKDATLAWSRHFWQHCFRRKLAKPMWKFSQAETNSYFLIVRARNHLIILFTVATRAYPLFINWLRQRESSKKICHPPRGLL